MTPETALLIQQQSVEPELYRLMQDIYANYTLAQIATVIARVRADIVMAELAEKM